MFFADFRVSTLDPDLHSEIDEKNERTEQQLVKYARKYPKRRVKTTFPGKGAVKQIDNLITYK